MIAVSLKDTVQTLEEVQQFQVSSDERLFSADGDEIMKGWTTDIYFIKTREILRGLGLADKKVVAEVFAGRPGIIAGTGEVKKLLSKTGVEMWALPEGSPFAAKQVVMRISGTYDSFGIYETALLGVLASSSGWATAAGEVKKTAGDKTVICFGARHVHPSVAPVMERAAVIGGADGCSCILGAKLAGIDPTGTVPHAVFLIVGDTVEVARAYKRLMPEGTPVVVLVDTFKDEAEETLRVASALGHGLNAVRLDTASERGGVTTGLVREVRARLDQAGYNHVRILVSGGVTPDRIPGLIEAGADAFGVGSYISGARAIDMTMDIKEVDGRPVAKRGRIPGLTQAPGLEKML
ncbi:MAG: nicotinate phosphoribosyltransferase [Bacillota bacterium]